MSDSDRPGLYVHVPFCKSKCPYCDFFSVQPEDRVPGYVRDLDREAGHYAAELGPFDTLYVGGGTPSLLTPMQISDLLGTASRLLCQAGVVPDIEVTVELNPADVSRDLLVALDRAGVNRLSLGVQSFFDDELRLMGRRHDRAGAMRAIERIREAGFAGLAMDLICGIPGSSRERWRANLEQALSFRPEHLSCYALTVAEDTAFGAMRARGELPLPSEDESAALFTETSEILEAAGYEHYEVSNFARDPWLRSQHNQKYWRRVPTLGLGPGAHSFDGQRRWSNPRDLDAYHGALAAGRRPAQPAETVDAEQARLERIALGMRTSDGVATADLLVGPEAGERVERLLREGLVTEAGPRLVPTRAGLLVADGIAELFC